MSIRDRYRSTFNDIAKEHGEVDSEAKIDRLDSLKKAIGYTRRFVVDEEQRHYRYDYYRDALSDAITRLDADLAGCQVVHLDIGCGPGLFSWVLHDHLRSRKDRRPESVVYYGYDHCANMIKLANLFWDSLPYRNNFRGDFRLAATAATLKDQDFSDYDVVVTFGYALVQVQNDPTALNHFAMLIQYMFPSSSCIVIAADAHSGLRREAFSSQCRALQAALNEYGVDLEDRRLLPDSRSVMFARLDKE